MQLLVTHEQVIQVVLASWQRLKLVARDRMGDIALPLRVSPTAQCKRTSVVRISLKMTAKKNLFQRPDVFARPSLHMVVQVAKQSTARICALRTCSLCVHIWP
jgi:hypothetical protein